jgi:hypothetical protein
MNSRSRILAVAVIGIFCKPAMATDCLVEKFKDSTIYLSETYLSIAYYERIAKKRTTH